MHEMSIAYSILDIVKEYAKAANAKKVKEIELEIGTLAGIEFEALDFALASTMKNPLTEIADIKIHKIKAKSECLDCKNIFEPLKLFDSCPKCKSYNTKLLKGKELKVKSLLID